MDVLELENKIINADCLDILKRLPDKCVDLVLTDPPYFGIVKNEWDNQWKDVFEFQKWVGKIGKEIYRVLKDNGSLYWFGDDKTVAYCQIELDKYFRLLNNLVWRKTGLQTMKGAESVFRSFAPITERCLFYDKGEDKTGLEFIDKEFVMPNNPFCRELKKAIQAKNLTIKEIAEYGHFYGNVNHGGAVTNWVKGYNIPSKEQFEKMNEILSFNKKYEELRREYEELRREYEELRRVWNRDKKALDVLDFPICKDKGRFHETQKPLNLISYLIERSSREGGLILDCFSGSGTTAVACHNLNRRFICIEKDPDYWAASVKRLEEAQQQLNFFSCLSTA